MSPPPPWKRVPYAPPCFGFPGIPESDKPAPGKAAPLWPEQIRGFGHVKEAAASAAQTREEELRRALAQRPGSAAAE